MPERKKASAARDARPPQIDPPPFGEEPAAPARAPAAVTDLQIEVVFGDAARADAPAVVLGRMERGAVTGALSHFDQFLGGWIAHAVDLGMIGSEVGELFFIPVPDGSELKAGAVVLAGMGEPGRFTRDDLRFLFTNVTFALTALGHREFATVLIGSNSGLPVGRAAVALLDGIADALARLPDGLGGPLKVQLFTRQQDRQRDALAALRGAHAPDNVRLRVLDSRQPGYSGPAPADAPPPGVGPDVPTTRITILSPAADRSARRRRTDRLVLQYTALADGAAIPVREVAVNRVMAAGLPGRLASAATTDQDRYGRLLTGYLIPEDFRQLLVDADAVALTLDADTAVFPWEMAVVATRGGGAPLGVLVPVARQFRSALTGVFGLPPPVNQKLKVLVIADPSSADRPLPGARAEGLEVLRVLGRAKRAWGDRLGLEAVVRIGSPNDPDAAALEQALAAARGSGDWVTSAKACDPLELLALLVNDRFDVVHFAGHGEFDPARGRAGWVFDAGCVWSAEEVFGVRHVPRLVFANACHSAEFDPDARRRQRVEQVGLAEAFFARGVRNYVGTGWAVDDELARRVGATFYAQALGLADTTSADPGPPLAPPGTIGNALTAARRAVHQFGPTWGAYHHYGQWNDKLLAFENVDATESGAKRGA